MQKDSVHAASGKPESAAASQLNGDDPVYIRELRQKITKMAFGGQRFDEKLRGISAAAPLARQILITGERAGLSGEDIMTLLAYNALLHYEKAMDICIENANSNVSKLWPHE